MTATMPTAVQAGSWVRLRDLPRVFRRGKPRLEPEWEGVWHMATGDLELPVSNWVLVVCRCGRRLHGGTHTDIYDRPMSDLVIADSAPAVDVCRRCARYAGVTVEQPEPPADFLRLAAARLARDTTVSDAERGRRLRELFAKPEVSAGA